MNARDSAAKLPEAVRRLIAAHPAAARRLLGGYSLEDTLSSPEWAADWAAGAETPLKRTLGMVLLRYGASAFEEGTGEAEALRDGLATGAEWRVALAGLRRSGVLFAVRKTWGERLFYVPEDMVPVWQRLLLPTKAQPLSDSEAAEVRVKASPFRLPLPLELLAAWSTMLEAVLSRTSKGAISKPSAARLAASMRLTPEELSPLELVYPNRDQLPATVALAVDLGLRTGVLRLRDKEVAVSPAGAASWMTLSVAEANAALHEMVVRLYASSDAGRHLAASAIASCGTGGWFRAEQIADIGVAPQAADMWLDVLVSFGWAARGTAGSEDVFRLTAELELHQDKEIAEEAAESIIVQHDGEIYVPPGVGLSDRWTLEHIAERVSADNAFVYRLTKRSCANAFKAGYGEKEIAEFLADRSGMVVPPPVTDALRDWFRNLGKATIAEVALLRTDSEETAKALREDAEISQWLLEQVGSRDFIVDRPKLRLLAARLEKIGYGAVSRTSELTEDVPSERTYADGEPGFIYSGQVPSYFEPDRSHFSPGELFPGYADIPQAWLRQPGIYHASTRRDLIRRAIDWRTELRIGPGDGSGFVPLTIQESGERWEVKGRWKSEKRDGVGGLVTLSSEEVDAVMIVLPDWGAAPPVSPGSS